MGIKKRKTIYEKRWEALQKRFPKAVQWRPWLAPWAKKARKNKAKAY